MIRWVGAVLVVGLLVLGFVAWKRSMEPARPAAASAPTASSANPTPDGSTATPPAPSAPAPAPDDVAAASGITWTVPAGWRSGGARAMRLATYIVGGPD